ncbi:MAG: hypothetical protein MZV64_72680 [Ignavibacteriales bacterium]|nr:hypothetical protein [Ignavibacteriales bacterium]
MRLTGESVKEFAEDHRVPGGHRNDRRRDGRPHAHHHGGHRHRREARAGRHLRTAGRIHAESHAQHAGPAAPMSGR